MDMMGPLVQKAPYMLTPGVLPQSYQACSLRGAHNLLFCMPQSSQYCAPIQCANGSCVMSEREKYPTRVVLNVIAAFMSGDMFQIHLDSRV